MKTKKKRKSIFREGQSIIEYIILLAVVIATVLTLFRPGGVFSQAFSGTIQQQGMDMLNLARMIF